MTDDRSQGILAHFAKISNGLNSTTRQPIDFVFGSRLGFSARMDEPCYFRLTEIHDVSWRQFWKIQMTISLKCSIWFTFCMHTYFALWRIW